MNRCLLLYTVHSAFLVRTASSPRSRMKPTHSRRESIWTRTAIEATTSSRLFNILQGRTLFSPLQFLTLRLLHATGELTKRHIAQLCRTSILPSRHRRIQGFALPQLSAIDLWDLEASLSNCDLDCDHGVYIGSYRWCSRLAFQLHTGMKSPHFRDARNHGLTAIRPQ